MLMALLLLNKVLISRKRMLRSLVSIYKYKNDKPVMVTYIFRLATISKCKSGILATALSKQYSEFLIKA